LLGKTDERLLVLYAIGSGLNAGRQRLQQLLKLVCEDRVAEVVVTERETGSPGSDKSISKRCSPALGWPLPCWTDAGRKPQSRN
jgi:hypothetical protein